jgi:two-component system, chemotaxis family, sensor kinase CheA
VSSPPPDPLATHSGAAPKLPEAAEARGRLDPLAVHSSAAPKLSPAAEARGRFISIGIKFAVLSVAVIGIAAIVAFFQATQRERARLIEAKRVAASMVADLLAQSLEAPLDFADEEALQRELDHLKQNEDVVYAGVWRSGELAPWLELRGDGPRFELPLALDSARSVAFADRVEAVRPVLGRSGKVLGSAVIQFSLARENAELALGRRDILFFSLMLALGTTVALIAATRREIVRPLERLLNAARRVERGERGEPVQISHNDEIGRLAGAFNAMNAAIFDREQRLAAANGSLRELFDHMRQGIVVFGEDGKIAGTRSRAAETIFGSEATEGADVRDLLYRSAGHWDAERRAFEEWLPLGFEASLEQWAELTELAPRALTLAADTPEQRDLALEFRPIVRRGRVSKIMLLATDETDRRRLERAMARQGVRHRSQLAVMRRLVAGGGQQFVSFLERARRRLERAAELVPELGALELAAIGELFQIAHTLRAEAVTLELTELGNALQTLEETLAELRGRVSDGRVEPGATRAELGASIASCRASIAESEGLFVEASPYGRAALETLPVRRGDVEELLRLASGRGDAVEQVAQRLASRPFGECVASVVEQAPSWAERENKRVRLEVEGREAPVPPGLADVIGGVLAHLVRNAIAHGIESSGERVNLGKPAVGSIELRCEAAERGAVLVIGDDGRGIGHHELLTEAARQRRPLENLGYMSLSTQQQPSDLAGRGVGLSAVEADLARVGYAVSVAARDGGGTRFEIRPRHAGAA